MSNGGMARQLKLNPHLTTAALEGRYRAETDGITRSHWQMLWLLVSGKRTAEVAALTSHGVAWVRSIVKRYNEGGPSAVGDQRRHNPGKPRLLTAEQEGQLRQQVQQAVEAGHSWTGTQAAAWMSQQTGRKVYAARGWDMLRRLGYTTKTPRPRHVKADLEAQQQFKKT